LPSGAKKFLLTNVKDIEMLLMNNKAYSGEIAANVSAKSRKAIVQRAKELNVRLTNGSARLKS